MLALCLHGNLRELQGVLRAVFYIVKEVIILSITDPEDLWEEEWVEEEDDEESEEDNGEQ